MTSPELIILVTTSTTSLVTVINAIANILNRQLTIEKLNKIHEQTNGGWAAAHQQLSLALQEIVDLKKQILVEKDKGV